MRNKKSWRWIALLITAGGDCRAVEQPVFSMALGVAERRTQTSQQNATISLFAAMDIATGAVVGKGYKRGPLPGSAFVKQMEREGATEFSDFLKDLDRNLPDGPEVHLVMDNHAIHKTEKVKTRLDRKQFQRGVHRWVAALEADIMACIDTHNDNPKPRKRVKPADENLASVKRFCLKTMDRTSIPGE